MKLSRKLTSIFSVAAILMTATAAHAASTSKVYMSNTLIFLFLGFCALVLAIQVVPAIITMCGMIKGAMNARDTKTSSVRAH